MAYIGKWYSYNWLSYIMFFLICLQWIMLYSENIIDLIIYILIFIFSTYCIFMVIYQLAKKQYRKCIKSIIPIIIAFFLSITPINLLLMYINSTNMVFPTKVRQELIIHSRHYVEFLIQKYLYIHEIRETRNVEYKEWEIIRNHNSVKKIVYDNSDELIRKYSGNTDGYNNFVYKVGEHYYMIETFYNQ